MLTIRILFDDHRRPMPALLPATLAPCGNSSTITLISAERRDGPQTLVAPRWQAATASTTPMRCALVGRSVF